MYYKSLQSLPSHYMIFHSSHHMVKQRITMTIDSNLLKKLRRKQAEKIKETARAVSLSKMIDDMLKKAL